MMTNQMNRLPMPIFISSTFKDMQAERDVLMKRVFPKLSEYASQRSVSLVPIDLRWGITQEESKSGMVIELCLYEIDRCRPFFIGILGGRYGWCPTEEYLKNNQNLLDQHSWLKKDVEDGRSITEIEMQYGVLRAAQRDNALFFIKRDHDGQMPEDSRLDDLIKQIESCGVLIEDAGENQMALGQGKCYYSYYDSLESLEQKVEMAVKGLIDKVFPMENNEDMWYHERKAQQVYLQELCDLYVPQQANESHIFYMDKMLDRYMMITSDQDCFYGKSAFVANWLKRHQNDDSHNFIYHFVGVGYLEGNYKRILQRLCIEVSTLYGLEMPTEREDGQEVDYTMELSRMLDQIKDEKPLYIIIDGLQHLTGSPDVKMLNWLPVIPDNVSLIVTTPYHDMTQEVFYKRYGTLWFLQAFEEEEERQFIIKYLNRFSKRLENDMVDKILASYSAAKPSPHGVKDILTLKSLMNVLILDGSPKLRNEHIDEYCENNMEYFYSRMFKRLENDFGEDVVRLVLCLIVCSKSGLSEKEILEISGATIKQWSSIRYSISHLLSLKGDRYDIDKITIDAQIKERYKSDETSVRQMLVSYFSQFDSNRSLEEILYQFYYLQDFDALYSKLMDLDVFSYMFKERIADLLVYWRAIYNNDREKCHSLGNYEELDLSYTEECGHTLADMGTFAKQLIGDTDSAVKLFICSEEIYENIIHSDHDTLATVYTELKEYDSALDSLEKILPVAQLLHDERDTYYPILLSKKGMLLLKTNNVEEGIDVLKEALSCLNVKFCQETINIYIYLASACLIVRDDSQFVEYIEKAIAIIQKDWGDEYFLMGEALFRYGVFHENQGHNVEAANYYRKALNVLTKWYPDEHETILYINNRLKGLSEDPDDEAIDSFGDGESIDCFDDDDVSNAIENWLNDSGGDGSQLSESDFKEVLSFFEGITDDLQLVGNDWEDGMREYEYAFRYKHDCEIAGDRYVYGPYDQHVYVCVDSEGRYISNGRAFDTLKEAQVHYLMCATVLYEQYCNFKNLPVDPDETEE